MLIELFCKHKVLGHFWLQYWLIYSNAAGNRWSLLLLVYLGNWSVLGGTWRRELVLEWTRKISVYKNNAPIVARSEWNLVLTLLLLLLGNLRKSTQLHQTRVVVVSWAWQIVFESEKVSWDIRTEVCS
jgi:hypothetical protein